MLTPGNREFAQTLVHPSQAATMSALAGTHDREQVSPTGCATSFVIENIV